MNDRLISRCITYRVFIKGMYLLVFAVLSSCTLYNGRKDKGYGASYRYTYTDTTTEGDSLLVTGRIIDPIGRKYEAPYGIVVEFSRKSLQEEAENMYVWCDTAGHFTIKLKKGTYDISTGHSLAEASFVVYDLGRSGNVADMEIHMQIRQTGEH